MKANMSNREIQIKALSSPVRLRILELLKDPASNFADQKSADPKLIGVCMHLIADRLNLSPSTITRHVDLLRQAEFVKIQKVHKWSYCTRHESALQGYYTWIGKILTH